MTIIDSQAKRDHEFESAFLQQRVSCELVQRPQDHHYAFKRSLLDFPNDIAEYRRNIAGVELLHCRELLLQSDQLIAKSKIFCVPTAVFGRAGLLDLALMKRTPRAQMG